MPYSYPSMTNPFMGLPLGKGVLNRASALLPHVRPGQFTPYQRQVPAAQPIPPQTPPTTTPSGTPPGAVAPGSPGPGQTVVGGPTVQTPTGPIQVLPGVQEVLASGGAVPASSVGLNPANYPGGMVTQADITASAPAASVPTTIQGLPVQATNPVTVTTNPFVFTPPPTIIEPGGY